MPTKEPPTIHVPATPRLPKGQRGGIELLLHVGIDTVKLDGRGFALDVRDGQVVAAGDALLRFDLDVADQLACDLAAIVDADPHTHPLEHVE